MVISIVLYHEIGLSLNPYLISACNFIGNQLVRFGVAREFRLYMDFDILTGPLQPENSNA